MNRMKKLWAVLLLLVASGQVFADEGMWVLKELNKQNLERMKELGFTPSYEQLYSETDPCVANAVVIFGGGCSGITVSNEGLIFTNHHCGFGSIQQLSSVEHDYLKDGFVSQSKEEELPVPGLTVRYLRETVDVSDRINSQIASIKEEHLRLAAADSIGQAMADSVGNTEFQAADVVPFYNNNKYFLIVYDVFNDVRMVFAPPSSVGKFGGDTDNWMWPRHTGDFSVFRVYAGAGNKPAAYSKDNKPYQPKYVAEVSLQGYQDKDYAMTIGFPGSTDRYLCSWGVQQRIEDSNKPRIEVRGIKQAIWKDAMLKSDEVRIKYASKYAGSSNYWKNSIGMNKGLANLKVIDRKREEEAAFAAWVAQDAKRKEVYGDVLSLLEKGYTSSSEYKKISTYLGEAFLSGAEIVKLARMIQSVDVKGSTPEEIDIFLEDNIKSFFKDYDASLDRKVLAAMMKVSVDDELINELIPVRLHEIYLGRYLFFGGLALLQATLVCAGDILFFGIQCDDPLQFVLAGWVASLVFSNIVYTLTVSFGDIGKALAVVLLVMQVGGSGGTFPIEMTGPVFQAIYPFLPFTHGINAMHAAMAGAYHMEYWIELGILASYLIPSLALGVVFRRPVIKANDWIIEKLESTKLI